MAKFRIGRLALFPASLALVFTAAALHPRAAEAHFPWISGIARQYIDVDSYTPVIRFNIGDNETPAAQMVIDYSSDNPTLVPEDDDHIILGGSGSDRTVQVIPNPGENGIATIAITVTDGDGDKNRQWFEVEVIKTIR